MPKYAPAEDGLKPWVVLFKQWTDSHESIVYARGRSEAEYAVKGRQLHAYAKARRATPEDMERLS
jgi:hypothetical protein